MTQWTGRRTLCGLIAAIFLLVGLAISASAGSSFRPRIDSHADNVRGKAAGTVTINDQIAIVLMSEAGGHGPAVRAQQVANRLQALVDNGLAAGEVKAQRKTSRVWEVSARGDELALVTSQEATVHKSSSESLARAWAAAIRHLLTEPPITFSPSGVTVPLAETRTVQVGGAAPTSNIAAQDSDSHITQSTYSQATRTLTIRGLAPGRDSVSLTSGDVTVDVPVAVMKYAAMVAPTVAVTVTGNPAAPASMVQQAMYAGLTQAIKAEPGANVKLTSIPKAADIASSAQSTFPVALHISGANLLPVDATAVVTVQSSAISEPAPVALFYSNHPEQVKDPQTLFIGRLHPAQAVRLDYHHQNISAGQLVFHTDIINQSDAAISVHVISGLAIPGLDTVQVGRRAGATFMNALGANIGLVIQIPPHTRVPIVTQKVTSGLTVSGLIQMDQIVGPDGAAILQVSTDQDQSNLASPMGRVVCAALTDTRSAMPLSDMPTSYGVGTPVPPASPYVFGNPQISLMNDYAVGGKWAYIRIGRTEALKDATGEYTLWGNYGVSYAIDVTLTNPTSDARQVGLFFAPEAGLAAGVFRVDNGPVQELDPIGPPAEPQIAKYSLAPGETRKVHVETIPLNGSSYPVSIIAHVL